MKNKKELKDWFKNEKDKELRKKALFAVLKELMKAQKNILLEEMSEQTLRKCIGKDIEKFNYKIIVFQFEVSLKKAFKRDVQRDRKGLHKLMGEKQVRKLHEMHDERFDEKAILVNCNKLSKKEVVEFILNKI